MPLPPILNRVKRSKFRESKKLHLARIYFRELSSSKYFAGINFHEQVTLKNMFSMIILMGF